jgi:predicted RNA-binding protein YlqC (UPF0109 family)
MGMSYIEDLVDDCSKFLVSLARLLTDEPDLKVRVTVQRIEDPTDADRIEHRFILQVPSRYRGLLIGRRGTTAGAIRVFLRTYVKKHDCLDDVDVRVKQEF